MAGKIRWRFRVSFVQPDKKFAIAVAAGDRTVEPAAYDEAIVARDGATLVIVEVRARTSRTWGGAAASVGLRKQRRLIRAAQLLLAAHPEWRKMPARFDVIVEDGAGAEAKMAWIRHAFML